MGTICQLDLAPTDTEVDMWSFTVYRVHKNTEQSELKVDTVADGKGYPSKLLALRDAKNYTPADDEKYQYKIFVREE